MSLNKDERDSNIQVIFECNGSDEVVLIYEERRLEIALFVQALEVARQHQVDLHEVSIRFVQTTAHE